MMATAAVAEEQISLGAVLDADDACHVNGDCKPEFLQVKASGTTQDDESLATESDGKLALGSQCYSDRQCCRQCVCMSECNGCDPAYGPYRKRCTHEDNYGLR